jgi:hypothetical protein
MKKCNLNFALNVVFPVFISSYEGKIKNAENSILKIIGGKMINFSKIKNFSDNEKQDFILELLQSHGNIKTGEIIGVKIRLFTQKNFSDIVISLKFADDEEFAKYQTLFKALIGLEETPSEVA